MNVDHAERRVGSNSARGPHYGNVCNMRLRTLCGRAAEYVLYATGDKEAEVGNG